MKVHYISSYVDRDRVTHYYVSPSATSKVSYIKDTLKELGYFVSLFSPIRTKSESLSLSYCQTISIDSQEVQNYPFSFGGKWFIIKWISYFLVYIQLILYLCFKVKKNDIILLYHSNPETRLLGVINIFLKRKVVVEVEELYSAVFSRWDKIHEEENIIKKCSSYYILVNNIMRERCKFSQSYVVCEGQYRMINPVPKTIMDENGYINVLYAGVFEPDADVFCAIDVAKYLPNNYIVHIAGYGDESVVREVESLINNQQCESRIVYHGCLFGDKYEELLKSCSIGLCPRQLEDALSDYTFPSKVFMYLSRNLKVICTPIACVKNSKLSSIISFSKDCTSQSISTSIKEIDSDIIIDNSSYLNLLDTRFKDDLRKLIECKIDHSSIE